MERGELAGMYILQKQINESNWRNLFYNYPIKDGRLVNDQTFAIRLKSFLKDITPCDPYSEEELEYLRMVVDRLLEYQVITIAKDSDEERYLKNNGILINN